MNRVSRSSLLEEVIFPVGNIGGGSRMSRAPVVVCAAVRSQYEHLFTSFRSENTFHADYQMLTSNVR